MIRGSSDIRTAEQKLGAPMIYFRPSAKLLYETVDGLRGLFMPPGKDQRAGSVAVVFAKELFYTGIRRVKLHRASLRFDCPVEQLEGLLEIPVFAGELGLALE
jgi:hypothetical protein